MNRVGLTGIIDAAGGGMSPQNYFALFNVWQQRQLPIRVAYYINGQAPTQEAKDLKQYFQGIPANFGDDMMKVLGIGEVVVWGMHDGAAGLRKTFTPKPGATEMLKEIAIWAAERRLRIQIHASSDSSASQILYVFEEINGKTPIGDQRWVIAHIEDASIRTLQCMKALGMGWAVQDRLYLGPVAAIDRTKIARTSQFQLNDMVMGGGMMMGIGGPGASPVMAINGRPSTCAGLMGP